MTTINSTVTLTGEEGLLIAVIRQALRDALGRRGPNRADAWRYLASDTFEDHVTWLGLPAETVPVAILEIADGHKTPTDKRRRGRRELASNGAG